MPKIIYRTTLIIATLTILTVALYKATSIDIILTFAITLGTTLYHFIMRLLVGLIFNQVMRNRADYTKSWYQVSNFENRIYKKLNVKKWKNNEKGLDTIREHAREFIAKREAPAVIPNDGKQTPMKGHPVFVAQHATATCCRECIRKWHKIQPGRELSRIQQEYLVDVIMTWIEKETTN